MKFGFALHSFSSIFNQNNKTDLLRVKVHHHNMTTTMIASCAKQPTTISFLRQPSCQPLYARDLSTKILSSISTTSMYTYKTGCINLPNAGSLMQVGCPMSQSHWLVVSPTRSVASSRVSRVVCSLRMINYQRGGSGRPPLPCACIW